MSEAKPRTFRASSLHTDTGSRLKLPLLITPNRPKALMEGKECTKNFIWICCPCFIELQSFAGVSEFPFRAASQPSPAGRIRKTVSVLTGQIPQSFGLYLKAGLPAFHLIPRHRPRRDIIGSPQRREVRAYH